MPPALESEPLHTLFIYLSSPPVTYFYSKIIVTVIFFFTVFVY